MGLMESQSTDNNICVNPLFQLMLIILSCTALGYIFYFPLSVYRPGEDYPVLMSISPGKEFYTYNPPTVHVGLYINRYQQFNILDGNIVFSGIIWFEYDPTLVPFKVFENITLDGGQFLYRSHPITRFENGKMFLHYDVVVKLTQHLMYKRFPFDDHRLIFSVIHEFLGPKDVIFEASDRDVVMDPIAEQSGWVLAGTRVKEGYIQSKLRYLADKPTIERSAVTYYFDYSRNSAKYGFTIFLPMFFILFLTLFSFSLSAERFFSTNIAISTGGITGMIAYRFVIESLSPKVSYFMMSDYFFLIIFSLNFSILIMNIIFTHCNTIRNKIILVVIHAVLVLSSLYIVVG